MATQVKKRTSKAPIAAAVALLFALLGGVLSLGAAWGDDNVLASPAGEDVATNQTCDDESPVAGYIVSKDGTINDTPYSVVSTDQLFPSQLMLDPSLERDFTVSVSGTDNAAIEDVSKQPLHNDQIAPLGIVDDTYNYKYYKFGEAVAATMVGFGDEDATKGKNPDEAAVEASFEAARKATITVDYGTVGTYSYNDARGTVPVRMQLVVNNIVPQISAEFMAGRDRTDSTNNNPVFQFAKDPSYGVYFFNVHSADFDIVLTNADTGDALGVDDIYLTQSSLSYWQKRGLPKADSMQISEMTKPLSKVTKVYFSEASNIASTTDESFSVSFDNAGIQYPKDGEDGFFIPLGGEDNSKNHYTDTVGHEEFPRNAVTFRYADTSHMNFRNATSSNTMWFTIYPQALTNQTPPDPIKTAYTEPTKGVYAAGEDIPEGSVRRGSEIEFVVDQEVNKLGISSLVRYHELVLSDVVPNDVTIKEYDVVDEDGNSVASHGEWKETGDKNTYTFSFDQQWLQNEMPLNGEHYYLKLKGIVNEDAADVFKNRAETIVNEIVLENGCKYNHFFSNVTEMNVVEPNTSLLLTNLDEEFTFQVAYRVPEDANEVSITDELEPILEAIDASVDGLEGVDAVISADRKTITVSAKDSEDEESTIVTDARGKVVTLAIKAKIREGVTEEELAPYIQAGGIPNTASVAVNDRPAVDTNKVVVVPPPVKKIENDVHKKLDNRDQEFTYSITHAVPEKIQVGEKTEEVTSLTFVDTIDTVLDIVGNVTISAGDFTKTIEVDPKADKIEFTLEGEEFKAVAGKGITVSFKAVFDKDATDEDIAKAAQTVTAAEDAAYGVGGEDHTGVPNTANFTYTPANDEGISLDTNTVTVEVPEKPEDPEKFVNGQKGVVELKTRPEEFTYTVTQLIPSNATEVSFEDKIEDVLEIVSYAIDGAAEYADQTSGNTVKFETTDATADRGKTVTLTVVAKMKAGITDEQLIAKYGSINVPNVADVTIDNQKRTTNKVEVRPPLDEPEKTINDQKEKVELANRADEFTYKVIQTVPAGATEATFTDKLEDVLEVVSYEISNSAFATSYNAETNTVSATATGTEEAPIVAADTIVTLTIQAKIKDSVTDADLIAKYGSTTVPNEATVSINGESKTTNKVEVTPPDNPGDNPVKKVNGVNEVQLQSRPEVFTYTISQTYPGDATTASFYDKLEDVLEIVGTPTIDGAGEYEISVEGNVVTVTGANVIADRGKVVTLTINAKIRESVTDADLIAAYGTIVVPNKATVTINNTPKTTNIVEVTPPPTNSEIVKTVNDKQHANLETEEEVFTYKVAVDVPADANTMTISDTIVDELEFVGGASDVVVDLAGQDIEAQVSIEGQKLTVAFETFKKATKEAAAEEAVEATEDQAANEEAGEEAAAEEAVAEDEAVAEETTEAPEDEAAVEEVTEEAEEEIVADVRTKTVTVTFQAKIRSGADLSKYFDANGAARVPNTASYMVNDDPNRSYESNTVTVTPPTPPVDEPEKFINGQKELLELENRTDSFTYTVVQKLPSNAVSAVFEDTLESVLEVVSVSIDGKAAYTNETNGNVVKFSTADATADRGQVVTLTIVAKLRAGVTDEELVALYTTTRVPNKATVTINGNPQATNEVQVTPPDEITIVPPDNPPLNPPTEEPPVDNPPAEEPPVDNPPAEEPPTVTPPVTYPPTTTNPPVTSNPPSTSTPKTSDDMGLVVVALAGMAVLAAGAGIVSLRRRKED